MDTRRLRLLRLLAAGAVLVVPLATAAASPADTWQVWARHRLRAGSGDVPSLGATAVGRLPFPDRRLDVRASVRLANGCLVERTSSTASTIWCNPDARGVPRRWLRVGVVPGRVFKALSGRCVTAGTRGERSFCWHWNDPAAGISEVTSHVPVDPSRAFIGLDVRPDGLLLEGCSIRGRAATCINDGRKTTATLPARVTALRRDVLEGDVCVRLATGAGRCWSPGAAWRVGTAGTSDAVRRVDYFHVIVCHLADGVVCERSPSGVHLRLLVFPGTSCPAGRSFAADVAAYTQLLVLLRGHCVPRRPAQLHVHVVTRDGVPATGTVEWLADGIRRAMRLDAHGRATLAATTGAGVMRFRRLGLRERVVGYVTGTPHVDDAETTLDFPMLVPTGGRNVALLLSAAPTIERLGVRVVDARGAPVPRASVDAGPDPEHGSQGWLAGARAVALNDGWSGIDDAADVCPVGCDGLTDARGVVGLRPETGAVAITASIFVGADYFWTDRTVRLAAGKPRLVTLRLADLHPRSSDRP